MLSGLPVSLSETMLSLTQEEAFALLEMCTLTLATENPTHLQVLARLGHLCRTMLSVAPIIDQVLLDDCLPLPSPCLPREQLTIACLY